MTHSSFTRPILSVLENVSPDRLQKAVEGFVSGAYQVRITRQAEAALSAFIMNGDAKQYGVTITEHGVFCSCPDSMYRRVTCKHAAALALYLLRSPKAAVEEGQPTEGRKPNLTLVKSRPAWVAAA